MFCGFGLSVFSEMHTLRCRVLDGIVVDFSYIVFLVSA